MVGSSIQTSDRTYKAFCVGIVRPELTVVVIAAPTEHWQQMLWIIVLPTFAKHFAMDAYPQAL